MLVHNITSKTGPKLDRPETRMGWLPEKCRKYQAKAQIPSQCEETPHRLLARD
jgi:hypothetical protein